MADIHVLLVTGEYPPMAGGVGDYTERLAAWLAREGVESTILAPVGQREQVIGFGKWGWPAARKVADIATRVGANVVHIQYQAGAFDMHPSANLLPCLLRDKFPTLTTFHDLRPPYLFPKAGVLRRFAILRMARASTRVVVTNPFDAATLAGREIDTVEIPIGPNLPPPDLDLPVDRDTVAFFGLPSRAKGMIELIEAIGLIDPARRPRLMMIGDMGTASANNDLVPLAEIEQLAADLIVRVDRTGYLPAQQASNALARSGVVALPFQHGASLRSGSLLAALQSGRPVVTTEPHAPTSLNDVGRMPQLQIIPRNNIGRLSDALEVVLAAEDGVGPLPWPYGWPSIAAAHASLYASVIEGWERRER
ncbi:MAG TPA: glycosyltransferase [Thermomicrobiales bacterium]|nr:glycosyltransferase [Thermomicrobiales bacterium]